VVLAGTIQSSLKAQIALSALHREHGLNPSHLFFFNRHLSQALHTRLRMPSLDSCEEALAERDNLFVGERDAGDMVLKYYNNVVLG